MTSLDDIVGILRDPEFRSSGESFDRRPLINKANQIGPPMRLLHWNRLEQLGYLPHFDEQQTEDAIAGVKRFGAPAVEIFMVSHRWLRPSVEMTTAHPDDHLATKARALTEFSLWRRAWVSRRHRFSPEIYYWIDFCCFDQRNVAQNLVMLPLWIACCERLLCFVTGDYHTRAWCRLELLLAHTFGFADHQTTIGPGFQAEQLGDGEELNHVLLQPTEGALTDPQDAGSIQALEHLASQVGPSAINRTTREPLERTQFGITAVKMYRL